MKITDQSGCARTNLSQDRLEIATGWFFALFLFGTAFSIALAQVALGLTLLTFLAQWALVRRLPSNLGPRLLYFVIAGYVGWLAISSLAAPTPLASLAAIREEWLFVILPLGIFLGRKEHFRRKLIMALAAGALLAGTYGLLQHFTGVYWLKTGDLHTVSGNYRLAGNFSHPLTYGYYVATISVFLLNYFLATYRSHGKGVRIFLLLATLTTMSAAVLSMSRGPLLAVLVGLAATAIYRRQFGRLATSLIVAACLAFYAFPGVITEFQSRLTKDLSLENHSGRLYIWNQTGQIIKAHPVAGVGLSNFGAAYSSLLPAEADPRHHVSHAHNDYLNIAATTGIPGLLGYLSIWTIVALLLWRRVRDATTPPDCRALAGAALLAGLVFCTASMTEAAFADEELRQLMTALWAFGLTDG